MVDMEQAIERIAALESCNTELRFELLAVEYELADERAVPRPGERFLLCTLAGPDGFRIEAYDQASGLDATSDPFSSEKDARRDALERLRSRISRGGIVRPDLRVVR